MSEEMTERLKEAQHKMDVWRATREPSTTRTFVLFRNEDVSGVSGTGVVADGVEFADGTVVLRWRGEHKSTVIWPSISAVEEVHGHNGATKIIYTDGRR